MTAANGHTDSSLPTHDPERLARYRADLEFETVRCQLLETRQKADRLEHGPPVRRRGRPLAESWGWDSSWWASGVMDILGRFDRDGLWPVGPTTLSDRRYGADWPFFRSEQDLNFIRQPARILCGQSAAAIRLLTTLTSYVVWKGYAWKAVPRQGVRPDPLVEAVCAAVQQVVDRFFRLNRWKGGERPHRERELFWRSRRDGEFFALSFAQSDGTTLVELAAPEAVRMPPGADWREYLFGVRTDPAYTCRPLEYAVERVDEPGQFDFYEPDEVTHYRINVDAEVKRGLTDFFGDVRASLHAASRLQGNLETTAAMQAAIAYVMEFEVGTSDEAGSFAAAQADYQRINPWDQSTEGVEHYRAGRKEHIPKGQKYVNPPMAENAGSHIAILAGCYNVAASRYCGPSWMASGSNDAANFATALVEESPLVRFGSGLQEEFGEAIKTMPWRAAENWCGRWGGLWVQLPGGGSQCVPWRTVQRLVELSAVAPTMQTRNKLDEANKDKTEIEAGFKSPQMAAEERGYDWSRIEGDLAEIAKEKAAQQPPAPPEKSGQEGERQRTSDADRPEAAAQPGVPVGLGEQVQRLEAMVGRLTALLEAKADPAPAPADVAADDPAIADDQEYGPDTARLYAELMADVLYGVHGDSALAALRKPPDDDPVTEQTLQEAWDSSLHPRGKGGKFIPKGSAEAVAGAKESIAKLKGKPATSDTVKELAGHLSILTVAQLRDVHKEHGVKAPGKLRAQLVAALLEKLPGAKPAEAPAAEVPAVQAVDLGQFHDRIDQWIQGRGERTPGSVNAIRRDIRAGKPVAPLIVKDYGGGDRELVDGSHRAAAYRLEGVAHVPAYVVTAETEKLLPADAIHRWKTGSSPPASAPTVAPPAAKGPVKYGPGDHAPAELAGLLPHAKSPAGNDRLPDVSRPALGRAEAEAVGNYASSHYKGLNATLRAGKEPTDPEMRAVHDGLRSALAKVEDFPEPVTVYRGLEVKGKAGEKLIASLEAHRASGAPLALAGYQSTTTSAEAVKPFVGWKGGVELRIAARRGLDAQPYSRLAHERELILDHNSQYRVKSVREEDGGHVVELEQLPAGAADRRDVGPAGVPPPPASAPPNAPPPVATALPAHPLHDQFTEALAAAAHLPEPTKAAIGAAWGRATAAMPAKALGHASASLHAIDLHPDFESVTAKARAAGVRVGKGEQVRGYYRESSGEMAIDHGGGALAHEVVAHELAHAMDGRSLRHSGTPEWKAAFKAEIAGGNLGSYARTDAQEGFAEFARLVYAKGESPAKITKQFPKASKYFKAAGLWPEGAAGGNA
jgi:hypothetical protein